MGAPAGRPTAAPCPLGPPDERPVRVPRLALAAVRVRSRTADDTDGAGQAVARLAGLLARAAVADTLGPTAANGYRPDAAIVNLYAPDARLGLHYDEEPSDAPVVTISVGDTGIFRLAGVDRRGPFTDTCCDPAICSSSEAPTAASTTACRRCSRHRSRRPRVATWPAQHHGPETGLSLAAAARTSGLTIGRRSR